MGFGAYNEGINDDLNKAIWAALHLEPQLSVEEAVQHYARLHFGSELEDKMTQVLLGLEANWVVGDLLKSSCVIETMAIVTEIISKAGQQALRSNWRLAMYAFRAALDAYTQHRYVYETAREQWALQTLGSAVGSKSGLSTAIIQARTQLQEPDKSSLSSTLRQQVLSLASVLNESAGELSQHGTTSGAMMIQHQNPDLGRASWETPLSSAPFLELELARLQTQSNTTEQERSLLELLTWQDAEAGYYDNLGVAGEQPHLVQGQGVSTDPSFYNTSYTQFAVPGHGGFNESKTPVRCVATLFLGCALRA